MIAKTLNIRSFVAKTHVAMYALFFKQQISPFESFSENYIQFLGSACPNSCSRHPECNWPERHHSHQETTTFTHSSSF